MKYKKNMIGIIVLLSFFLSATIFAAAEPTLESISIDPEKPTLLSDITVTADIGGEGITAVVIHIKECNKAQGICLFPQSEIMTELEHGQFQAQITLKSDSADYIQYYFDITIDGEEVQLLDNSWTIDLVDSNDNIDSNDNNEDNETPGFEFMTLIASIGIGFILFKKKRF